MNPGGLRTVPVYRHDACVCAQEMGVEEGISLKRWERILLRRPFNWDPSLTQSTEALLPYEGRLNACRNRTFRTEICLCS